MTQVNEDIILARGNRAAELLQNPTFAETIAEVQELLQFGILQSAPEQADKRESYYNINRGVQELILWLQERHAAAESVKQTRDAEIFNDNYSEASE